MKKTLIFAFTLFSLLGFSQEKEAKKTELPFLISVGNTGVFNSVYSRLDFISKNITKNTKSLQRLEEMRQGQLIISTKPLAESFNSIYLETRPSLNIELQQIMFSGNFPNPSLRRFPVVIKQ